MATSLLRGAGVQEKLSIGKVGHSNTSKQNCKFALILYKKTVINKNDAGLCSWIKLFHTILTSLESEAVARRCSVKKLFLGILLNSQGKTCARATF